MVVVVSSIDGRWGGRRSGLGACRVYERLSCRLRFGTTWTVGASSARISDAQLIHRYPLAVSPDLKIPD